MVTCTMDNYNIYFMLDVEINIYGIKDMRIYMY